QIDIVGDGFERIVDFVSEADRDLAAGGELLALAQPADVAGKADRSDLGAVLVVDDRARDGADNLLIVLVAQDRIEVRDAAALGRAHRLHHAARFVERRIDAVDLLPDDLGGAVAQVPTGAVVVIDDGAVAVDGDDDIGRALD